MRAVTQLGVGFASATNSAFRQDLPGFFMSIAGVHLTALEPVAKAVPILGTFLNVVSTGYDAYQTYEDYKKCMIGQ